MRSSARTLLLALLLVATLAPLAQAARGARIERLAPCYVAAGPGATEPVDVRARGFSPGAAVLVRVDGTTIATVGANGAGHVHVRVAAPDPGRAERNFRVELIERDKPRRRALRRSRVAQLSAALSPATARPERRVRWHGRGFTASRPVYAHYLGPEGERRTVVVARPRGRCGRFVTRRAQFPFRPSVGRWIVQIDQQPQYSASPATPYVRVPIDVRRAG